MINQCMRLVRRSEETGGYLSNAFIIAEAISVQRSGMKDFVNFRLTFFNRIVASCLLRLSESHAAIK